MAAYMLPMDRAPSASVHIFHNVFRHTLSHHADDGDSGTVGHSIDETIPQTIDEDGDGDGDNDDDNVVNKESLPQSSLPSGDAFTEQRAIVRSGDESLNGAWDEDGDGDGDADSSSEAVTSTTHRLQEDGNAIIGDCIADDGDGSDDGDDDGAHTIYIHKSEPVLPAISGW